MPPKKTTKKKLKSNPGSQASTISQQESSSPPRRRIQDLIQQGNALDTKAQRDIAILNLHHKKGKKTVRNKQGKVVTSHRTNQKVAAFQSKIQTHEDQQAEYQQYANKSPKKINRGSIKSLGYNNVNPNSRAIYTQRAKF